LTHSGHGVTLDVTVTSPEQCQVFTALPNNEGAAVPFSGFAEMTGSGNADTSMVFVIDRSGSTCDANNLGCASDENYDLQFDDVLDCEIAAILDLVAKVRKEGSVSEVGLVSFSHKVKAIVSATIELPLTDINLFDEGKAHAIENAIRNINCGGATNYRSAVEKACQVMDASSTSNNVVVFISDGEPTRGGAPTAYCNNNAVFHTIALGPLSTCDGGTDTSLQDIAEATQGTCQQVPSIADIRPILKSIGDVKFTGIQGSAVASEGSVNFGCSDFTDFTNLLGLNCAVLASYCGGDLTSGFANALGQTADMACCACGGGIYFDAGELEQFEVDNNFVLSPNSLVTTRYEDTAIMFPGTHTMCTTVVGADAGVPVSNVQCKNILVCAAAGEN